MELELAAVQAALDQLDRLPSNAFMAINVSPATFVAPELEALIVQYPAERLVLELTEHSRVDDYDTLLTALDGLRRRGLRIAVDDTGAGYAGFQHILRLRPHILKLDTTLTRGIDADPVRRSLATALVNFAHEIGATIIAEGIEISGELVSLQRIGIPWGQGYHLARPGSLPLPASRLASLEATRALPPE
jgi:EAL domain-containing protein (putative c-di-GMP-specific phosphodiesterase class I)